MTARVPAGKGKTTKKPAPSNWKPAPRPKAGVFKLTPAEKAILNKRPSR